MNDNSSKFIPRTICNLIFKRKQYNQLDSISCDKLQDDYVTNLNRRIMASNLVGFENGRLFRIINVGDNSVIELTGKKFITQPQTCETSGSSTSLSTIVPEAQTFQCKLKDDGNYEISSKHQDSETVLMVWDYYPFKTHKVLIQKKQSRSLRGTQNWKSEAIVDKDFCYFILSAPDCTSCLKNMGVGKEIGIVPKTPEVTEDAFAHWKLERLNPVQKEVVSNVPVTPIVPAISAPKAPISPVVNLPVTPIVPAISASKAPISPVVNLPVTPIVPAISTPKAPISPVVNLPTTPIVPVSVSTTLVTTSTTATTTSESSTTTPEPMQS